MSRDSSCSTPIRVGVCSSEPMRMAGIRYAFEDHATIVAIGGDLETLVADSSIHYLILDLTHDQAWMEIQITVRRQRPDMRQIVLGPSGNEELIVRSIMAGARAYLDSNSGPLAVRQAVEAVTHGTIWAPRRLLTVLIDRLLAHPGPMTHTASPIFSPRERQVLDLILEARSNREIAEELGIEERTVKAYVASLLRKTGAENRVSLSVRATQDSWREGRGLAML